MGGQYYHCVLALTPPNSAFHAGASTQRTYCYNRTVPLVTVVPTLGPTNPFPLSSPDEYGREEEPRLIKVFIDPIR